MMKKSDNIMATNEKNKLNLVNSMFSAFFSISVDLFFSLEPQMWFIPPPLFHKAETCLVGVNVNGVKQNKIQIYRVEARGKSC